MAAAALDEIDELLGALKLIDCRAKDDSVPVPSSPKPPPEAVDRPRYSADGAENALTESKWSRNCGSSQSLIAPLK